jgi:hypothetical protein
MNASHAGPGLGPDEALALGQVLGNLGTHRLQFGTAAALYLSQAVGALHVLLEGSPDDIRQGFYRYWLPGEQQPAAQEEQQVNEAT